MDNRSAPTRHRCSSELIRDADPRHSPTTTNDRFVASEFRVSIEKMELLSTEEYGESSRTGTLEKVTRIIHNVEMYVHSRKRSTAWTHTDGRINKFAANHCEGEDCEANGAILVANRRAPRDPTKAPSKGPLFFPSFSLFLRRLLPPVASSSSYNLFSSSSSSSSCSLLHLLLLLYPFPSIILVLGIVRSLSRGVGLSMLYVQPPCRLTIRYTAKTPVVSRFQPKCLSSFSTPSLLSYKHRRPDAGKAAVRRPQHYPR